MSIAIVESLKNLKFKHKIFLILAILFILIINLGFLNISSVLNIQTDTQKIADSLIPRLIHTSAVKDNINLSILAAYDYVQNGDKDSKAQYKTYIKKAVGAEVKLFKASSSEADFEFTTLFETQINDIYASLEDLIRAFETGESPEQLQNQLQNVSAKRDVFANFLNEQIEQKTQDSSLQERLQTQKRVQQTIAIVIGIGILTLIFIYIFTNRTITKPLEKLTKVARSITAGKYQVVDIDNNDELGVFAETFNTMIQKMRAVQESVQIELAKTKQLDKQKSEFLSIAAHELRTPISGMKWLLDMTVAGDFGKIDTDAKEQLQKGIENINRMVVIINNLLEVAEIEAEQLQYKFEKINLKKLVKDLADHFEHAAAARKIKLKVLLEKIPNITIPADISKIFIALSNIVDNALKYTPENGVVTITAEQDVNEIMIKVADTGLGIPLEEQARVFSKLYRGSNVEALNQIGSGLGLYIAYQIIRKHEGDITFVSAPKQGTTFTVSLPLE